MKLVEARSMPMYSLCTGYILSELKKRFSPLPEAHWPIVHVAYVQTRICLKLFYKSHRIITTQDKERLELMHPTSSEELP